MITRKFGKLTVISEAGKASNGTMRYNCVCDCGGTAIVRKGRLLSGETETCGCKRIVDIEGMKFGLLTVTGKNGSHNWGQVNWNCSCDCGGEIVLDGARLRKGLMDHCGCQTWNRLSKAKTKHGMCGTRVYHVWASMKQRCDDIEDDRYGGRGIGYCEEWIEFESFYADMGEPGKNEDIDRINNEMGYSKENCRWTTRQINSENTRRSRTWTVRGVKYQTMREAMSETGMSLWKIYDRCHRKIDGCSTELKYQNGHRV